MVVFKHPISADADPHMPLFPDIYGFEGLSTFPPEIATFRNGTLMIFLKYSRKFQNIISGIVVPYCYRKFKPIFKVRL